MKVEYLMVMHVVVMNHIMWNGMVWCEGKKKHLNEWKIKPIKFFAIKTKKYMHQGNGGERMFSLLRGFGFSILSSHFTFIRFILVIMVIYSICCLWFPFRRQQIQPKNVQTFREKNTLCAMAVCGLTGRDKKILIQPSWHCATQPLISWIFAHLWCDNNFFKNISAICVPFSLHLVVDGARASLF